MTDETGSMPRVEGGSDHADPSYPTAFSAIILAAGFGSRMRSETTPKVLFPLMGCPLLAYPVGLLQQLGCARTVVVVGNGSEQVRATFEGAPLEWALQDPPRGTGDATWIGLRELVGSGAVPEGPLVILNGDLPLLLPSTIASMLDHHRATDSAMTLLTLDLEDPRGYGRIHREADGSIGTIVEEADADDAQKLIREVNGGVYVADVERLRAGLSEKAEEFEAGAGEGNAQGEFYFPPVIGPIREAGGRVSGWKLPPDEIDQLQQVNDRVELSRASDLRRRQIIEQHQRSGVTIVDPHTTYIEEGVEIGQDTVVMPFCMIVAGVQIGKRCVVGPFAHLREGTVLHDRAEIGNFMEVKKTELGEGAKAKHLSYLGNGIVGKGANIGAGTIFANYDGENKHTTEIGAGAFVGSGTVFVAPATLGDGARTGAGAIVKRGSDIAPGETVVGVPARPLRKTSSETRQEDRPE